MEGGNSTEASALSGQSEMFVAKNFLTPRIPFGTIQPLEVFAPAGAFQKPSIPGSQLLSLLTAPSNLKDKETYDCV
jgi:hypothetical protein